MKRIEQRYIVEEHAALKLRAYVRGHLPLDEHCHGTESFSYVVHDIYLDSDDLRLYWSVINSDENQLRLRLRSYGDHPDTPVFLETKQRIKNFLTKERVSIGRSASVLLSPELAPDPNFLTSRTRDAILALERFHKIVKNLKGKPRVRVAFSREAYRTPDASVNFDRFVRAEPARSIEIRFDVQHPILIWNNDVVVELKSIGREPLFFGHIVRDFGLRSVDVEKYVDAVALHGERRLRN